MKGWTILMITETKPLAERIRPQTLEDFYGVDILFEKYPFLKAMIEHQFFRSSIFYGPSGSGKTTFAKLLVSACHLPIFELNAVSCNKQDIVHVLEQSKREPVVLLLDEIHRLNKDKQELLLPVVESGAVVLIGLTTVHPYSSLPASIRSRVSIYHFEENTIETIINSLKHAFVHDALLQSFDKEIDDSIFEAIAQIASGDIRFAMNTLEELVIATPEKKITEVQLEQLHEKTHLAVDITKNHYDLVSALQKSIRGSDADGALYWLLRLAENQDVTEITRRLLVIAFEDVAFGNPAACSRVVDATIAAEKVGFPEAIYPLAYITTELALSPKSRTITNAIQLTRETIKKTGSLSIPEVLKLRTIDRQHYYDYANPKAWQSYEYLPNEIRKRQFYDFTSEFRSGKFEEQFKLAYAKRQKNK